MKIKKTLMLILGVIIFTVLAGIFTISNAATGSKYFSAKSIYRDSYSYQADEKTGGFEYHERISGHGSHLVGHQVQDAASQGGQ